MMNWLNSVLEGVPTQMMINSKIKIFISTIVSIRQHFKILFSWNNKQWYWHVVMSQAIFDQIIIFCKGNKETIGLTYMKCKGWQYVKQFYKLVNFSKRLLMILLGFCLKLRLVFIFYILSGTSGSHPFDKRLRLRVHGIKYINGILDVL